MRFGAGTMRFTTVNVHWVGQRERRVTSDLDG
jgi:hypothetical protein